MATVHVPPMMQKFTDGERLVEVEGTNVRMVIEALEAKYPGTGKWLREGSQLRPGIAVAIDGETATMGLIQSVGPDSEVHFIPAIGGG
ncbi:hypothetical protein CMK11_21355 [Candidatus Poribacteria bacterium]|jgi:molybdopterin synthase sulfur carrier subunit|nr:hypothetical protein [Candidatus Poribacteria bacterium]